MQRHGLRRENYWRLFVKVQRMVLMTLVLMDWLGLKPFKLRITRQPAARVLGWLLALSASAAPAPEKNASAADTNRHDHLAQTQKSIDHGHAFLVGLFDPELDLLPEFRGSKTYWLFHDNYLAAHMLAGVRPDLSQRIRGAMNRFGVTNSGKIEILFEEAPGLLPFCTYQLTDIATNSGKRIRTEIVTTNILKGWEEYADLLLLASIAEASSVPQEARRHFDRASAMWDEHGFKDRVVQKDGIYATYKLAFYLIAAKRLKVVPLHRRAVLQQLFALQASDGGWKTDYNPAGPVGLSNVETTCLALLAVRITEHNHR